MTKVAGALPVYEKQGSERIGAQNGDFNLLFPAINKQMPKSIGNLPDIDLSKTDFLFDNENFGGIC